MPQNKKLDRKVKTKEKIVYETAWQSKDCYACDHKRYLDDKFVYIIPASIAKRMIKKCKGK